MAETLLLKDLINSDYMNHASAVIIFLRNKLGIQNLGSRDRLDTVLDITDVTITAEALTILDQWQREFGLTVVDTKSEYRQGIFENNKKIYEAERVALNLNDFTIGGKFTEESLSNLHRTIQHIYKELKSRVSISANMSGVLGMDIRPLAIYFLRMNDVINLTNMNSVFAERSLLPAFSQLLHNCTGVNKDYWQSIKETYPEGSELYVWTQEDGIVKCRVDRQEEMSITVYCENQKPDEESDGFHINLRYGDFMNRYIFAFPTQLIEPVKGETLKIYEESEILPRKVVDPNKKKSLTEVTGINHSDMDFPKMLRDKEREEWIQHGVEPEDVDLIAIMKGAKSPYSKLFSNKN